MRTPPSLLAMLMAGAALLANAQSNLNLHDSARNRDIPVKIYYPSNPGGPLPVIVFSHGFGASKDNYGYLGKGWSDAGYIVILPTHEGSSRSDLRLRNLKKLKEASYTFNQQVERTADISFVISSLDQIERQTPVLGGRLDRMHIGVSGHSEGAGTALLIAGAKGGPPGAEPRTFRDQRVSAVIAMSPQGPGEEGFFDRSWDDIRIPVMTMSGTKDSGIGKEGPEWRVTPFQRMPPGNKYHVLVKDAIHLSFAAGGSRFRDCIISETTAFWDEYLKNNKSADSRIQNSGPCTVSRK